MFRKIFGGAPSDKTAQQIVRELLENGRFADGHVAASGNDPAYTVNLNVEGVGPSARVKVSCRVDGSTATGYKSVSYALSPDLANQILATIRAALDWSIRHTPDA